MRAIESRPDAHGAALGVAAHDWRTHHGTEVSGQLDRRRTAACRVPVLRCGCTDPWLCRCGGEPALTEHRVDAHRAAAVHLLDAGLLPLVPIDALRALWRRGGRERELAVHLGRAVVPQ